MNMYKKILILLLLISIKINCLDNLKLDSEKLAVETALIDSILNGESCFELKENKEEKSKAVTKNKYRCKMCSYSTNREHNLLQHKILHINIKPYKCSQCSYSAARKAYVSRHYINKHTDDFSFECEYCTYKSKIKHNLIRHLKTKHFVCKFNKKHESKEEAWGCKEKH